MIRKIFITLLLFCFYNTQAWGVILIRSGETCADLVGDIDDENFEETGTSTNWTAATGSPDFDATWSSDVTPSGGCDESLYISSTASDDISAVWDLGAAYDVLYIRFKFSLDTRTIGTYGGRQILRCSASSDVSTTITGFDVYSGADGNPYLRALNTGGADFLGPLSLDTLYSVIIKVSDRANGVDSQTWWVEGDSYSGMTASALYTAIGWGDCRYIGIGGYAGSAGTIEYYVDMIEVDDDGTFD